MIMTTNILQSPTHLDNGHPLTVGDSPPNQDRPDQAVPAVDNRIVNVVFWAVALAVAAVALGSFALSFNALHDLAIKNGQPPALGWVWPLIVDTSLVIYTAAILVAQLQRRGAKLPILLTVAYALVTVTGNILHAPQTPVGWFVAALPPMSLILGSELLRTMGRHIIERRGLIATLATLTAHTDQARADLDRTRQEGAANLDKLTRQIEQAQAKLAAIQQDITQAKTGKIQEMTAAKQAKIDARRQEVLTLLGQGKTQGDIAAAMGVGVKTIRRDIAALNGAAVAAVGGVM